MKSADEIFATLDERRCLDSLPFMPEMLKFCNRRFIVYKRADKTCDTIAKTGGRRLFNTVHLGTLGSPEGIRCDGAAHGGCEAGCLLFWNEAWLRRVDPKASLVPEDGIDGASELRIWAQIVMPLCRPALTTLTIFCAIEHWNDFLGPLVYLNSPDKFTVALGLNAFQAVSTKGTRAWVFTALRISARIVSYGKPVSRLSTPPSLIANELAPHVADTVVIDATNPIKADCTTTLGPGEMQITLIMIEGAGF